MTPIPFGRVVRLVTTRESGRSEFRMGLESIEKATGRLVDVGDVEYEGDGISFEPGDVLFGKLRPNLAKAWLADRAGDAVGDFHVYRPEGRWMTSRYLAYLVLSEPFLGPVVAAVQGAKMPRADWSVVRNIEVHAPALPAQRAIADYLDRETAQIDAFIAKNEELVVLLAERRDSLWTELYDDAATAGELVPVRRLVASIVDGPFGSSLTSAHYSTAGTRVIRLGNIGINEFKHADEAFISTEYAAQLATHAASAGDVIVAGLGDERMPLGRACVLPDIGPAIVKADCYRVRPNRLVSAEYLAWVLSAPPTRGQMRLLARGTTRLRLNTSVVRDVQVPVPSTSLQAELAARFRGRADEIDAASTKAEHGIVLARERRAALISAAVTGKIDVGVAA